MAARRDKDVKFVRIKGRVVPIRTKKTPGKRRTGDTKTRKRKPIKKFEKKFKESIGFQAGFLGGGVLAGLGFGGRVASEKAFSKAVEGAMFAFDAADSRKFERIVKFASKAKKVSKKFEIIGLGLQAVGAAAGGIEALLRR